MFWLPLAMAAAGAVSNKNKQDAQQKRNLAAAEGNRYSNWTHKTMGQDFSAPTMLDGALQGGVGGLALSQQLGSMGGASTASSGAGSMSGGYTPPTGILGSNEMTAELSGMGSGGFSSPTNNSGPWGLIAQNSPNKFGLIGR